MRRRSKPHVPAMAKAVEALTFAGLTFRKGSQPGRMIVTKGTTIVDLWPTTERWRVRAHGLSAPQYATHKGIANLIQHLTQSEIAA